MRCPDYDDPTKMIDETAEEYLCEYCCIRGRECDGKGNITSQSTLTAKKTAAGALIVRRYLWPIKC